MAAEKRKVVVRWTKKTQFSSLRFCSLAVALFLIERLMSFFRSSKETKCVFFHSFSDLLKQIREGGTRGTHRKRFVLSFFPPHKTHTQTHNKNLKTHTHARHHLATTTTTTGGGDDDDDRKIV